jgi:long-subunit fatty acid transport protein
MINRIYKATALIILLSISSFSVKAQQINDFKERGVIYISTLGFVNGFNKMTYAEGSTLYNQITALSIHQSVGYQLNPYFSIGMGLGYEKWKRTSFIPLYADIRANLLYNRYSPFINIDFGYSSKWYESPMPDPRNQVIDGATEGVYFSGGIGLKIMFSNSAAGIISLEYKLQESSIKYSDDLNQYSNLTTNREDRVIYQFIGFRAGVLF